MVLTKSRHIAALRQVIPGLPIALGVDELKGGTCLIAFGIGEIIPPDILSKYARAYNFHFASPEYPGRDPHHWAAYDCAPSFGATAHIITDKIDQGAIVGTLRVGVPKDSGPDHYRALGEQCGYALFRMLAPIMLKDGTPAIETQWAGQAAQRPD